MEGMTLRLLGPLAPFPDCLEHAVFDATDLFGDFGEVVVYPIL